MLVVVSLVLAQAAAGGWSSARPPECGATALRTANVWERAKSPELRRYCDRLAAAASKLAGVAASAQAALDDAREADRVLPGRAAPRALEGRALAMLGDFDRALGALTEARSRDARALEDPPALLAWARSLARTGRAEQAAEAYRALLPRSSVLSTAERVSAEIEAALVAMARGADGLDEAVASLREAVRESNDEAQTIAVLGLALALDRRGQHEEARALLGERGHGDPRDAAASARGKALTVAAPAEVHAMSALALESTDVAGAKDEWQRALEAAPGGKWASYAAAHVAALERKRVVARETR